MRHVLLTMLQALAQLLAASPDQVQRIVQGEGGGYIKHTGMICSPCNIVKNRSCKPVNTRLRAAVRERTEAHAGNQAPGALVAINSSVRAQNLH